MKTRILSQNICILHKSKFRQLMRHNEVADQAVCNILSVITLLQSAGSGVTIIAVTPHRSPFTWYTGCCWLTTVIRKLIQLYRDLNLNIAKVSSLPGGPIMYFASKILKTFCCSRQLSLFFLFHEAAGQVTSGSHWALTKPIHSPESENTWYWLASDHSTGAVMAPLPTSALPCCWLWPVVSVFPAFLIRYLCCISLFQYPLKLFTFSQFFHSQILKCKTSSFILLVVLLCLVSFPEEFIN